MARMKDLQIENHNRLCLLPLIRETVRTGRAYSDAQRANTDIEPMTSESVNADNAVYRAAKDYWRAVNTCFDAVSWDRETTGRIHTIIDSFVDWYEPEEPDYAGGITAWDD